MKWLREETSNPEVASSNPNINYLKNNFSDGYKQDAFDVLLGISNLETKLPDFDEKLPFGLISVGIYFINAKSLFWLLYTVSSLLFYLFYFKVTNYI